MKDRRRTERKKGRGGESIAGHVVKAGPAKAFAVSAVVSLLLAALGYWLILMPADAANRAKSEELRELRKQNAVAALVQDTRPTFMEEYRNAKAVYVTARELLPTSTELSRVMSTVQAIARKNNVKFTSFDARSLGGKSALDPTGAPAPPAPPADGNAAAPAPDIKNVLKERVIPIQVVGRHAAVMNFFREVAGYVLIIHARDPKIQSLNGQESVNVQLVSFEAPPSGALPADPPDLYRASLASAAGGGQ
ncbi:MAG: hypothetical protein ACJ74Q_15915 [Pyrinomonadaceae bacterium]